jgi:ABC-type amino acid transport substrate-binding protein
MLPLAGLFLALPGKAQSAAPVLRVGVVDGSQPCSYREKGAWTGLAVELWARVAQSKDLPYVLRPMPSINAMLEATRSGQLDVAVECINITPERLRSYRFSLPFQEDGQAVLVANDQFSLGKAFLEALLSPMLLRMVGVLLLALLVMSGTVWWVEGHASQVRQTTKGPLHRFIMIFTILLTGEGDSAIVDTSRGRAVLMAGYLVRNISSAVLVGFLTVELVQEAQGHANRTFDNLNEIGRLRVGYKPGTVSEELIKEMGLPLKAPGLRGGGVPQPSISSAMQLLQQGRIDAVLADGLQLRYLLAQESSGGLLPVVALSGIRPELQGFGLSPQLPVATVQRIDLAIAELKRSGEVLQLQRQALGPAVAREESAAFR